VTFFTRNLLVQHVLRKQITNFSDLEVYSAILVAVVVSAIVTYQADVSGVLLWSTAFFSTLFAAAAFFAGLLILKRYQQDTDG
jgi:hypothetical protein